MLIGYAHISTDGQTLDPQLDVLKKAGCEKIFSDVASGAKTDRPGLIEAINYAREGDTITVVKLDRFGRSMADLIARTQELAKRKIEFKSLSKAIDTGTPSGKLLFHVMGALAEFERERTKAGLTSARARGRVGGRPKTDTNKLEWAKSFYDAKVKTLDEIKVATGVSKSALYRYINYLNKIHL
jgi:DNA invertase Pin-like site-specific DNA recombinase